MAYTKIVVPADGERISVREGKLSVPDNPILLWIEGDGIGPDILRASKRIWDAAVQRAYGGQRRIAWMEIYDEKATNLFGGDYFPAESLDAIREFLVGIKGPLTTPVGGGFRSLNVALRKDWALYACIGRSSGIPVCPARCAIRSSSMSSSSVRTPRTSTQASSAGRLAAQKVERFLKEEMGAKFWPNSGIGIKPISEFGSKRHPQGAGAAVAKGRKSVTFVHKGNIQKFTEGAFMQWGYELAKQEFGDVTITEQQLWDEFGGKAPEGKVVVKDRIADIMFQQMLLRPAEYDVIATPNLNGDYLSDAVAAEVGGVGIAPGGNVGDYLAVFEATHGTAPKYADQDKVNPGSVLLSGVMMLDYIGWTEAADAVTRAYTQTVADKIVTYDFARQMDGAREVKTSEFATAVIERL